MSLEDDEIKLYPCEFPIKVMGRASDEFEAEVLGIIRTHFPDLPATAITSRFSKDKNYLALTIVVEAQSRAQLDTLYHALNANQHVIMAL